MVEKTVLANVDVPCAERFPRIVTLPGNTALLGRLNVTVDPVFEVLIWLAVPETAVINEPEAFW